MSHQHPRIGHIETLPPSFLNIEIQPSYLVHSGAQSPNLVKKGDLRELPDGYAISDLGIDRLYSWCGRYGYDPLERLGVSVLSRLRERELRRVHDLPSFEVDFDPSVRIPYLKTLYWPWARPKSPSNLQRWGLSTGGRKRQF